MKRLSKFGLYLVILLILNVLGSKVYYSFIENTLDNVLYGNAPDPVLISHGGNYTYLIESKMREYEKDVYLLVKIDSTGKYKSATNFRQYGIDHVRNFDEMYTAGDGDLYITVEDLDGSHQLYFLGTKSNRAVCCYSTGENKDAEIYGMVEDKKKTTFLVKEDKEVSVYVFDEGKKSSEKIEVIDTSGYAPGDKLFHVLSDGSRIFVKGNTLHYGKQKIRFNKSIIIGDVWRSRESVDFYDYASGAIYSVNFASKTMTNFFNVESWTKGLTDLYIDMDGEVWMIDDADKVMYLRNESIHDITAAKSRPFYFSIIILSIYELFMMFIALLIWYFPSQVLKMHISFIIRWAVLLAMYFYVISTLLDGFFYKDVFRQQNDQMTTLVNAINVGSEEIENFEKLKHIRSDATRLIFTKDKDGNLYYEKDGRNMIIDSLYYGSKYRTAIEEALKCDELEDIHSTYYVICGKYYYVSALKLNEMTVRAISVHKREDESEAYKHLVRQLVTVRILLALLWILIILLLLSFRARINRISRRIRNLIDETQPVRDLAGDEISAMNDALDTAAFELRAKVREVDEHNDAYERFLPNNMLKLLRVQSVYEISRETCAEERLIMMTVSFKFASFSYDESQKVIYDRLNHVIERTGEILNTYKGMVLDYRHDGFTALFRSKNSDAIRAAIEISQEFQKEKEIKVHITIDTSLVMTGIVGTDEKYQPISISPSFSITGSMLKLFESFEAGILCTENAVELIKNYDSRYIGKLKIQDEEIRIYEIYEGDMPDISRKKKEFEKTFAEGLYSFYVGDYRTARAAFLEVVREDAYDGPAKFYLYMADKYEDHPPKEFYLNLQ